MKHPSNAGVSVKASTAFQASEEIDRVEGAQVGKATITVDGALGGPDALAVLEASLQSCRLIPGA